MTELTFLLELLLNHKLPKPTREAVTARVREVEAQLSGPKPGQQWPMPPMPMGPPMPPNIPPHLVGQAPSTIAAMMRHPDMGAPVVSQPATHAPAPVAQVAVTPAAQAAMSQRQESINLAISGKPEKGRTSPRKF